MSQKPKPRNQKLVDAIYPFFWNIAVKSTGEAHSLRVCRHLLALKDQAIYDPSIAPLIDIWSREHPEEKPLVNPELLWALDMLEKYIAKRVYRKKLKKIKTTSHSKRFWVIHGGLSPNPDRPYVAEENILKASSRLFE